MLTPYVSFHVQVSGIEYIMRKLCRIFAFDVYTKYGIERNYILGCFSQIHLIL